MSAVSDRWWVMSVAVVLLACGTPQQSVLTFCPELPRSAVSHGSDGDWMPGYVCAVTHERASVVKVEKHLKSNKKKSGKKWDVRKKRGNNKQTPELKGTTVGCKLVEEFFFLNRVCLWVFWYKNIIVNLGWPLHVSLPCWVKIYAAWSWKFPFEILHRREKKQYFNTLKEQYVTIAHPEMRSAVQIATWSHRL